MHHPQELALRLDIGVNGGASIADACRGAQRIADILGVEVGFVFNEVGCLARPFDDPANMVADYHYRLDLMAKRRASAEQD